MHKVLAFLPLALLACSGGERGEEEQAADAFLPPATVDPAPAEPAVETGIVHDVRMVQTPEGQFAFLPAELTIRQGDAVRWINASEGPHNVAFAPNRIPAGAARVLEAAIRDRLPGVPLATDMIFEDNATIEISFAGAPLGTYQYHSTPREVVGMRGTITVTQ